MKIDLKPYKGKNVDKKELICIKNKWYWLTENKDPEARELLGRYNVNCLGWGNTCCDWNSFSIEEKELLKTTLK